jgi:signal transduction histidine kinase/CheY-like chemotaxis protein
MLRLMVLRGRIPSVAHGVAVTLVLLALLQGVASVSGLFDVLEGSTHRLLYDTTIVASAFLLAARVVFVRQQRLAWGFVAAGLACWAAGDLSYTLIGQGAGDGSYPSVSDVLFVACFPFFTIGLIALARENLRGHTRLILLDGLTAALATTSLALALLYGPATQLIAGNHESAYAPTLAYPVCDFLLLAFAVGALAMSASVWRRTWVLLAAGWALAGVGDMIHVYDAVAGGYHFGSSYDFVWPLATVLIAWAGWQVADGAPAAPIRFGPVFAFPSLFALPALGVLVYDHYARVGLAALAFATATIVMVFARVGIALRQLGVAHEAQLRVRERDAQALRLESLGQLAGGVAHDFNNLLAVILNYSHFLATSMPEGDERRADAEEIGRTAERAATLAHQLLLFSRRGMSRPEVVDIAQALKSLETMVRATVRESIQLQIFAVNNLPPVSVGAGQFDQIVLNLAVNARDAMQGDGRLSIFADEVRGETLPAELQLAPGPYVRITVRDTGAGMSEQVRDRAFEPFFSTKSAGHGTGLGLATVYGIVEHAGGTVELRSREGAGTSVLVYLPAAADVSAHEEHDEALDRHDEGDGELVLLVEDEPALRLSTSRILSANGYEVLEAADGEEALTLAAEMPRPIDLLLTDVVMPNISGVELARRLHAGPREIPVIFVSGNPAQLHDDAFNEHGRLLLKPLASTKLLTAVREALDARVTA